MQALRALAIFFNRAPSLPTRCSVPRLVDVNVVLQRFERSSQ